MKKFRPILFSTPMVQSILKNVKNQTRRTKGLENINKNPSIYKYNGVLANNSIKHVFARLWKNNHVETIHIDCPYGQIGDVLWVRESFVKEGNSYLHRASHTLFEEFIKWKPSIHMPKDGARIFLEITDIKAERLQDISNDDAINEGVEKVISIGTEGCMYKDYVNDIPGVYYIAKVSFHSLWNKINGIKSWDANPWVWVIKLKKTQKPQNFI